MPYKRSNLAAYVSVDSDATSPTYGQMRVINVIDEQQQGPGQVANAVRSDNDVADALAQFNRSGSKVTYGNLLTVPVGDELMYVEPIYASLSTTASESTFPILRYVLVSYRGGVGIGTNLTDALAKAKDNAGISRRPDRRAARGEPTAEPDREPTDEPTSPSTADPGVGRRPARPGPGRVRGRRPGADRRRPGGVPGAHQEGPRPRPAGPGRRRAAAPRRRRRNPRRRVPPPHPDLGPSRRVP